jgi:hypothetical protein
MPFHNTPPWTPVSDSTSCAKACTCPPTYVPGQTRSNPQVLILETRCGTRVYAYSREVSDIGVARDVVGRPGSREESHPGFQLGWQIFCSSTPR